MDPIRPGKLPRTAYRGFHPLTTRWADNDVFGHVNNAAYYGFFDTAVTGWLLARGLIGLAAGPMWVVAETGCRFFDEIAFPQALEVGMVVARLGSSSAQWQLGLFQAGAEQPSAEGHFVHVHVDRLLRRPAPMPDDARAALATMQSPE